MAGLAVRIWLRPSTARHGGVSRLCANARRTGTGTVAGNLRAARRTGDDDVSIEPSVSLREAAGVFRTACWSAATASRASTRRSARASRWLRCRPSCSIGWASASPRPARIGASCGPPPSIVDLAWNTAAGRSFTFAGVEGRPTVRMRISNAYLPRVIACAHADDAVATALMRAIHFLAPPTSLFARPILAKVLLSRSRQRRGKLGRRASTADPLRG